MIDMPKDSQGVEFDPMTHNLIEETATPEATSTGKWRKVRGAGNAPEVIERFIDSLPTGANDAEPLADIVERPMTESEKKDAFNKLMEIDFPLIGQSESTSYPTVKNYDPMIAAICANFHAAVRHRDGSVVVFERGELAGAINLANYETTEKAIEALKTTSLAR